MEKRRRAMCFVDGFNLYHAIHKLKKPHLKWFDLHKLIENFIDPARHELVKVYYFSAYAVWLPDAHARHQQFVEASKAAGIHPIMGQFKEKDKKCHGCKLAWKAHEEKETDVNIALYLLNEAYKDNYDEAFLVSRDSDLTPAVKMILEEFPNKSIKVITPPGAGHSKDIAKLVGKKKLAEIKEIHLERSLLSATVTDPDSGIVIARRPQQYGPPK